MATTRLGAPARASLLAALALGAALASGCASEQATQAPQALRPSIAAPEQREDPEPVSVEPDEVAGAEERLEEIMGHAEMLSACASWIRAEVAQATQDQGDYRQAGGDPIAPLALSPEGAAGLGEDGVLYAGSPEQLQAWSLQQGVDLWDQDPSAPQKSGLRVAARALNDSGLTSAMRASGHEELADYLDEALGDLTPDQAAIALVEWDSAMADDPDASLGASIDKVRSADISALTDDQVAAYGARLAALVEASQSPLEGNVVEIEPQADERAEDQGASEQPPQEEEPPAGVQGQPAEDLYQVGQWWVMRYEDGYIETVRIVGMAESTLVLQRPDGTTTALAADRAPDVLI